jgi:signal transduction histidine kinase/CRISPR/Cas system-associated endoribonuclease Cas2
MLPAAALPADLSASHDLLHTLLEVSLTAVNVLRPLYDPAGELVDFALVYVNPAGQRINGLPEHPDGTLLGRFPHALATGIFDYYRRVYEEGATRGHEVNYQADGLDNYFRLAAQRSGDLLVVSFTDTSDQDRSAVEEALRESQALEQSAHAVVEQQRLRFREVLTQMPAYIAVYQGPDHIYQFVNPAYQSLFPHRSFLGRPFREGTPESIDLGVVALFDQVYQTGEPVYLREMEGWFDFHGNGQPVQVFLDISLHPLRDVHGRIDGVMDFTYDVSEQVRARRQVEQLNQELEARVQARTQEAEVARDATERQRRQWEELFMRAPASICIFDGPEWVYQFVNPGYQAMFPGRHLLGKRLIDALPEVADQPLMAILHHVYDTGEPFQQSEVLVPLARTEDGPVEDIYFDLTYLVRRDEAGQIDGFVTYAYDVTEQVYARREREDQRQRLHRLFMEAPAAICILSGPDLVYELVNADYQALFPGRELLGKPILLVLPEIADNAVYATFRQVYDTGRTHEEQAMLIPLARPTDGVLEERYFRYIQQARYTADGRIDGVVVFAFEVTEQVRIRQQVQDLNEELTATNEELSESNAQLTRTNVDLDTFVYTASHDLKAPIANIEGILLALRHTLPADVQQDEMVAHLLALLNQTVARFQVTIGQLTDITRLQLAHTGPAEPVVLAMVVEDVRLDLAPAIAAAGTELTVVVSPELVVSFSLANMRSIVYNLLSNAIKYRAFDRPSQVQVHAEQTPHAVHLTVQDNGLGISEVQQRQLFGLFQRLHTHVEGTGVGLYITKRLVENAGGTIAVASQPHVGTTFTVTFPA